MKIIGPQLAASVLTIPLDDVRPVQGITPQQIVDVVVPRYGFPARPRAMPPSPFHVPASPGVAGAPIAQMMIQVPTILRNGVANIGEQKIVIVQLDVMPDVSRIVVHTVTTDEGDVVLDDLVVLLEAACGFRNLKQFTSRLYVSNIIAQFDKGLEDYIPMFKKIQEILTTPMRSSTGINEDVKIERLAFAFDPLLISAVKSQNNLGNFVLERRQERPFSENRYFSSAPLRTTDHIQILEKIAAALEQGG